ncbi:MAG: glycoside hydrolase family 2 [Planctomycetes bacterium]|nr:glycoside hydrolase family 2 [Planctomycetota bacterium]
MRKTTARIILLAGLGVLGFASLGLAQDTEVVYLSGHGKDDPVPWEFLCTAGRNSGTWTTIGVPSNWELQGFGNYNYGNERKKADEQGKYRRRFTVPVGWADKRVFLVFEGVMTDTEASINGRSAGPKHQGGFYRFKYEITDLLKSGENLLEVTVSKVSADASVEDAERQADYWVFGGIYRPVYLEAVPRRFIDWIAVDARADGTCRLDVHLNGTGPADSVGVRIIGPREIRLGEPFETAVDTGEAKVTLRTQVQGQRAWTAETPNLYTLRVDLRQGGQTVHSIAKAFGFRTFEVRPGDGLYLNGQKIRLKGVCRHSFWPDSGRCLSKEISYADVRLIKEMNMNAVRMSHYPPDQHFLDACDELGLYVLDELAGWQKPPYDTEIGKKLVREMVPRDVCHPCILFWDNGNEGGWNRELDDQFALYDPQNRTVLHPWENLNGIDTAHYRNYETSRNKLDSGTLYLPTEFLHGLYDGGHGAGLDDYWSLMQASPLGAGGFLWVLADEGVVRTDRDGQIDVAGNQAPDGIVGPYRQKEASFYTVKEIWSPIHIDLPDLPPDFDGTLELENRYDFTNLRDCRFQTKFVNLPGPADRTDGPASPVHAVQRGPDVAPHGEGILKLDLPTDWRQADALVLTAFDRGMREIWTWCWDLQGHQRYVEKHVKRESTDRVAAEQSGSRIGVRAGDLSLMFDSESGTLLQVTRAGRQIEFGPGPRLIGGEGRVRQATTHQDTEDGSVQIRLEYDGALRRATWTILPTGWISLDYEYELNGQFDVFGINFDYPESKMQAMRVLGRGPYRVWKNRLKGGTFHVWSNRYKNDVPGVTWDFPEFKGYYRDWRWVVFSTAEGEITIVNATPELYLGVYRPNDGPFPANTKLSLPQTGLAFLHGIPPIGTKFDKPQVLGPQSQKNEAAGTYRGTLWFHFDTHDT